ncbi:MAG: EamA family transporter RarD [Acidobacteria bacterium]|nr:EamA family transporter RarD [Acidobacteriota bacterium]
MSRETKLGLLYTTGAFLLWGIVPVYWKMLQHVPAIEILAHRIVWGLVFVSIWMTVRRRWPDLREVFGRPGTVAALLASTIFIATNWGLFIYAVVTDRVLATSLGYFINPLVNILLGLVVLHERLNRRQWTAVALASLAVVLLTVQAGELPWISLVLPVSFGLYSLLRKTVHADAVVGLTFETAALTPLAVGLLVHQERLGVGALGHLGFKTDFLLVVSGAVTAVPLILFTLGVRRIRLSTAGLLQYIAPTCTFLLAVLVYDEPFSTAHAISFGLIWAALAIYSLDLRARLRQVPAIDAAVSPAIPPLED